MAKWSYSNPMPSLGELIPWPHRPCRAWVIRPCGNDQYHACVEPALDQEDEAPGLTQDGPLELVRNAMRRENGYRRGLPLIFGDVPEGGAA